MSTRSTIAYFDDDTNTIKGVYCHFDGYVDGGVGETLVTHYQELEQVKKLVELGNLSSLGEDLETTIAYHRDRNEDFSFFQVDDYDDIPTENYNYLFIFDDDDGKHKWVYEGGDVESKLLNKEI